MWERWNGYIEGEGFYKDPMNSFNHYSFGSVGRWIYQYLAGIDTDEIEVGFEKIVIKPHIGQGINHTVAWYSSPKGSIGVEWHKRPDKLDLEVSFIIMDSF